MARYIRNYEVIRELGAGHFGTVFLAAGDVPARGRIPGKRRLVAIKKLKNTADRESVDLLLQEFSLLEQVKHRCIVRVFEYLEEENAVVMEFIHGVTLREVLSELDKAHEQIFTEAAIEIGCEISDALYQAFTTPSDNGEPLQLVHRDLKPANIMLTPTGEVKILDFGLARVDNADFARDDSERIRGTPIYMAPEQARGEIIDHRSDLFGLGLILYELLMGEAAYRVPVDAADPMQAVFTAIESGDLQGPCSKLERRLPGHGPVITRMLRPRPEDRYRNGHEVMVDLRRQLYRDRGAYLQEFCEFFFGSIHDIGTPPALDTVAKSPRARTTGQKSIAERLRESMARDKQASRGHSGGRAPIPTPVVPTPVQRAPVSSERRPSRAQTFRPDSSGSNRGALRSVGERRPDETGMLEMVPLSERGIADAGNTDPSSTTFFAVPAPGSNRTPSPSSSGSTPVFGSAAAPPPATTSAAPPPPGAYGGTPPPGYGNSQPTSTYGAPPPPTPVAGVAGYGAGAASGHGGMGIQGPVVQSGNPTPNNGSPFVTSGGTPDTHTDREQSRTRSYQVFAIIFAVLVMVCVVMVGTVWIILTQPTGDNTQQPSPSIASTTDPDPPPRDTGGAVAIELPEPPPAPVAPIRPTTPSTPSTPSTPAQPAVSRGSVQVRVAAGAEQVTEIVARCPDGTQDKQRLSGGRVTLSVSGSNCELRFKGPALNSPYKPVSGGMSLNCRISGTVVTCS